MKTRFSMLLVLLPLTLFAREINNGDNIDMVKTVLGEPRGRAQAGSRELLCFDRGEVELTSGVVTRVALRSAEAQIAHETKQSANALRIREEQARLIAAGETLKATTLADAAFQATPLSYQVAFWENFSRQYGAVSCKEQLSIARIRLAEQEETSRVNALQAQRLAELEARAAEADREDRIRHHYPIYTGYSYGYDRGYRATRPSHDRIGNHNSILTGKAAHQKPFSPGRDGGQVSSHTAMVFSGQNWLGWPTPAESDQAGSTQQTAPRHRWR